MTQMDNHNIANIDKCCVNDIRILEEIDQLCFPKAPYPMFVLRQLYDLFPDLLFKASIGNEIIGYTAGAISMRGVGWALSLAILPANRNLGIGKSLLMTLMQTFHELNTQQILTTVSPDNIPAIKLCSQLGFVRCCNTENYFGDGHSRDILEYKL
jgi:ribosomal protein S18 acetylase RimI-like enzyme